LVPRRRCRRDPARGAFEETEALAQQVAQRIQPGAKHWTEVYEKLKDDHPAADGTAQAYQAKIDAAKAFVIEHKIVTLPPGERVITIDTPPAMRRSSPFGTFQSSMRSAPAEGAGADADRGVDDTRAARMTARAPQRVDSDHRRARGLPRSSRGRTVSPSEHAAAAQDRARAVMSEGWGYTPKK
jgi:hypothetical protein